MKVLMLQSKDLEDRGIRTETVSELIFRGKLLIRGATFSTSSRQAAVEACKGHLKAGIFCILVDNGNALTLWSEQSTAGVSEVDPDLDRRSFTLVAPQPVVPGSGLGSRATDSSGRSAGSSGNLTYRGRPVGGNAGTPPPVSTPVARPNGGQSPSTPLPLSRPSKLDPQEEPSIDREVPTRASTSLPPQPVQQPLAAELPQSAPSTRPPQMTYRGRPISRSDATPSGPVRPPTQPAPEEKTANPPSDGGLGSRMGRLFRSRAQQSRPVSQIPLSEPAPQTTPSPAPAPVGGRTSSGFFYRGARLLASGPSRISGGGPGDPFRSFFENAAEGLYQAAADGRFTNVNPALCQFLGYDSPQELLELTDVSRLYVDPSRHLYLIRQLQSQESVDEFESEVIRRDGQRIWISESVRAIRDRLGNVIRYEGVVRDITDKRGETAILGQRYQLLEPLGSGGFGETFLAKDRHRPNHPICVVKKLTASKSDSEFLTMARRLFQSEAETLERIGRHNQIPQLLAYVEQGQTFYLVQELIEGSSLANEVQPGLTLGAGQTVAIVQDLLQILAFVHSQDVIHRDIKPSNIIRRKADQRLVLIDFGAVKQLSSELTGRFKGATVAIGTPGYMPLEQSAGRPRKSSDIYAVGIIAIQALTGLDPEKLEMDEEEEPIWRPHASVSEGLAAVIDQMVRCHFAARYQSALDALQALRSCGVAPVYPTINTLQG